MSKRSRPFLQYFLKKMLKKQKQCGKSIMLDTCLDRLRLAVNAAFANNENSVPTKIYTQTLSGMFSICRFFRTAHNAVSSTSGQLFRVVISMSRSQS